MDVLMVKCCLSQGRSGCAAGANSSWLCFNTIKCISCSGKISCSSRWFSKVVTFNVGAKLPLQLHRKLHHFRGRGRGQGEASTRSWILQLESDTHHSAPSLSAWTAFMPLCPMAGGLRNIICHVSGREGGWEMLNTGNYTSPTLPPPKCILN